MAVQGEYPRTIKAAATAAPSVNDPSAVMSGNAKIRKLMNTPSASSARISPTVQVPMSSVMTTSSPLRQPGDVPDCPPGKRALASPDDRPRVAQQVEDRLDPAGLEQVRDRR